MNLEQCYALLGLQKGASILEIKSAYRRMVLEYHPDKNVATNDDVKFKLVTEAYQTIRTKNVDVDNGSIYEKPRNQYRSYRELLTWIFYLNLLHDVVIYGQKMLHAKAAYRYFLQYVPVIFTCGRLAQKYSDIVMHRFTISWYAKTKSVILHALNQGMITNLLKYLGLHS
ncbi:MAG: J domain-containing protein [Nitrosotalea sp.]